MSTEPSHLLFFAFLFLSSLILSPCMANDLSSKEETEHEKEFSYTEEVGKGPKDWGKMHHEWKTCDNGKMQSPIDLSSDRVELMPHLGKLEMKYIASEATVKNRGHDIMVQWIKDAGHIKIGGTKYSLKQCHWHSPSEHTFNGTRHDLELHMVHQTPDGKIAVVGVTYILGKSDEFLEMITADIGEVGEEAKPIGYIDPADIKFDNGEYYRYQGSLTVPPCTEGVIWTIVKKVKTVSKEQVAVLREAVHDNAESNARPVQGRKKRKVGLYAES